MRVSAEERQIIKAADRLHKAIDRAFAHDNCPFSMALARELEVFRDAAAHLRWSYPVTCELQAITPEQRLGTMFSGPLFTSEVHPWPMDKKGNPLEPICQIDLTLPSQISGLLLGDGLLQVWMDGVDGRIRLIAMGEVGLSTLTPVPENIRDHVWRHPKAMHVYGKSDAWTHGHVVTGVYEPVLTIPETLVNAFDEKPDFPGKKLNAIFDAMESALQECDNNDQGPGQIGFFGNFSNIQYREIECPDALLVLESGDIFLWGDCGNSQIFYEFDKEGKPKFSFDWSCT